MNDDNLLENLVEVVASWEPTTPNISSYGAYASRSMDTSNTITSQASDPLNTRLASLEETVERLRAQIEHINKTKNLVEISEHRKMSV